MKSSCSHVTYEAVVVQKRGLVIKKEGFAYPTKLIRPTDHIIIIQLIAKHEKVLVSNGRRECSCNDIQLVRSTQGAFLKLISKFYKIYERKKGNVYTQTAPNCNLNIHFNLHDKFVICYNGY